MLATGGSAVAALDLLVEQGARHIRLVNLVAAPEGIRRVRKSHPRLPIFTAAVDRKLNAKVSFCLVWAMRATGCLELEA